jgi:hypothetical protein
VGGLPAESLEYGYNSIGMPTTLSGTTGYVQNTTRRLARQLVTDDTSASPVQDTHYTYDASGNPTVVDTHADSTDDVQCYRYDGHDRLAQAWTATDGCAAEPSTAVLGGPAPYWQTYGYDPLGNRTSLTDHGTTAGSVNTTTNYGHECSSVTAAGVSDRAR